MAKAKLIKKPPSPSQRMRVVRDIAAQNSRSVLAINIKLHEEITKNFSPPNKPKWFIEIKGINKKKLLVGYTAEKARGMRKNMAVYRLLNDGTNVRRAKLSKMPQWISKTTPGRIGSGQGQGFVLDVGKQYNFEGIEAGNWDEAIAKLLKKQLDNSLIKGYRKGLDKAHGK